MDDEPLSGSHVPTPAPAVRPRSSLIPVDLAAPQSHAAQDGDASARPITDDYHSPAPQYELELLRTRVAWSKLIYLVTILAVLLGIAQVVPYTIESVQYALTRGKMRAEYEVAGVALKDSPLDALSQSSQRIAQRLAPSIVHINTTDRNTDDVSLQSPFSPSPFSRRHFTTGQGSGVIMDSAGYIITNYHVIRGSQQIRVAVSDGRRLTAKVIGYDIETDLAVLRVEANGLIPAEWGDSDKLEVGSLVWAMGSPFGLERSVTTGILSGKNREGMAGTPYQQFLQTDAAVNPGNSGGPLVDIQGRVIGINTAIVGDSYQGISFAVPSKQVKDIYDRIMNDGRVRRGWLGVQLEPVPDELDASLKLNDKGVLVALVVEQPGGNSPAMKAGVVQGDIILKWNGQEVNNPATLTNLVGQTKIGSTVELLVVRDGKELTIPVEVGQRPVQR